MHKYYAHLFPSVLLFVIILMVLPVAGYAQTPTPTTPPTVTPTPIPHSISGYVYNDLNLNKQWDKDSEPGLSSVPVTVTGPTNLTGATASDGYYIFVNLTNGTYVVAPDFSALGMTASSPATLTVIINDTGVQQILFGGKPAPPTATPTDTPSPTPTMTPTPTPTNTPVPLPTNTSVPTPTAAPTYTPAPVSACTLNVDPYRDNAGATFTFVGSGFTPRSSVALGLAMPDGSVEGLPAQQSNSAGSIGFSFTTKPGDQIGLYTMIAEGDGDAVCRTSAAFYLDDAPTPTPVKITVHPAVQQSTAIPEEATASPSPTATPLPLLTGSDPLLTGIDLVPLDAGILVHRTTSITTTDDMTTTASLPGIGGATGFIVQVYPDVSPRTADANKKEAKISVWTLFIWLGIVATGSSLVHWRKRLNISATIAGGLIISLLLGIVAFAQQASPGVPGKGQSRIEGFVTNADTGAPPPDGTSITVLVNGWLPVHSGKDGEWNITALGAGEYTVKLVDLPAGYNPKQPVQTVTVNGLESDVVTLDLAYWSGPAPVITDTRSMDSNRITALGTPTIHATVTTTVTTTTLQLPGISGAGMFPTIVTPSNNIEHGVSIAAIVFLVVWVLIAGIIYVEKRYGR